MRRAFLSVAAAALLLSSAGVAYAEVFEGGRGDNRYVGTPNSDLVEPYAGDQSPTSRRHHIPGAGLDLKFWPRVSRVFRQR